MVNQVVLVGRITRDLELRTNGNTSFLNFSLAVNRTFKNQSGEYEADFINCIAFNQTAQRMCDFLAKGSLVSVVGRIQTRNYENQAGQRVYITEVIASNVSFLESKRTGGNDSYNGGGSVSPQDFVNNSSANSNINSTYNNTQNSNAFNVADMEDVIDNDDLPF